MPILLYIPSSKLPTARRSVAVHSRRLVTAATCTQPDGTAVPALGAAYNYDDIGNRVTSTSPILGNLGYTANSANQYSATTSNDTRTVIGNAPANASVTVNSAPATRIGTLFQKALTADNSQAAHYLTAAESDGTTTQTRHIWLPQATTAPTPNHDLDGNLTNDGQWTYTWDAENRLVSLETTLAAVTAGRPFRKLTFDYDWTNHRLARTITDTNNNTLSTTRWLYDAWNPVAEYSGNVGVSPTLSKTYLWGLDLSGTLQGAGGVGGLLSVSSPITNNPITYNSYHPSYDGNGNITAWTQSGTTTPVNRREYDAFGNVVVEHGTPPCAYGFSTKLEDPETGLLYYGQRYYSPPLGRWISHDPIEERGGLNLYGFVGNSGVGLYDRMGLAAHYHDCNEKQKKLLREMETEARRRLDMWNDFLNPGPDIDEMMDALDEVGSGASGRVNNYAVIERFLVELRKGVKGMREAMDKNKYGFECECSCDDDTNAYIIRNWMKWGWDDDVHFCPGFFDDSSSIDSMVAAFTHELSHFPGTADLPGPGTKDDYDWTGPHGDLVGSAGLSQLYEEMAQLGTDPDAIEQRFKAWLKTSVSPPGVKH